MPNISKLGKVQVGKLYILPNEDIVRVVKINLRMDSLIVYNYHSHTNQSVSLDIVEKNFSTIFKISEAAKAVGRKPSTIRRYESKGLIPKARKIVTNPEGKAESRVYSHQDIEYLKKFFESRGPVGRPRQARSDSYNKEEVKNRLDQIKIKEKLNG